MEAVGILRARVRIADENKFIKLQIITDENFVNNDNAISESANEIFKELSENKKFNKDDIHVEAVYENGEINVTFKDNAQKFDNFGDALDDSLGDFFEDQPKFDNRIVTMIYDQKGATKTTPMTYTLTI